VTWVATEPGPSGRTCQCPLCDAVARLYDDRGVLTVCACRHFADYDAATMNVGFDVESVKKPVARPASAA